MKSKTAHLTARPTKTLPPARTEPALTPWFDSSIKPAREGVYETRWAAPGMRPKFPQYQRWIGNTWLAWAQDIKYAAKTPRMASERQAPEWRGLASNPARSGNK